MNALDWIFARAQCILRGHNMVQVGRLEQCKRCGKTWWDL